MFLLMGGILLPLIAGLIFYLNLNRIDDIVITKGKEKAQLLTILSIDALIVKDRPQLETIITGLRAQEPGLTSIQIFDSENQEIAGWNANNNKNATQKLLYTEQPIMFAKQEFGTLQMKWDFQYFSAPIISKIVRDIVFVLISSLCILGALMVWIQYSFIKPLEYLDAKVRSIAMHSTPSKVQRLIPFLEFKHLDNNLDQTEQILADKAENEARIIRAKEQVNAANDLAKARMNFLSLMSHEIRTPLGVMIGFGKLLETADLTDEEQNFLGNINQSGEFLLRIINDILDLSKIEANGIDLELRPLSISSVTEELTNMLSNQANQKQIEFRSDINVDEEFALIGDRHRLFQVLMNLASNAIKFTNEGVVSVNIHTITETKLNKKLRFEVVDTGVGMSKEQSAIIFDPFLQADCSTSREFGGTGLGLSISQQLVELMDGTIEVESTLGIGSTFSFEIEMDRSEVLLSDLESNSTEDKANKPVALANKQESPLSILVAEDQLPNRLLVEKVLNKSGYSVQFACDGQECLDLIDSGKHFDIIFLDLHMPKCGGLEIATRIRKGDFGAEIQEVNLAIMSADILAEEEGEGIGVDAFIAKPLNFDKLTQFIRDVETKCAMQSRLRIAAKKKTGREHILTQSKQKRQILVVEDQKMNQVLIGALIREQGHTPSFANDGIECVERLEDGKQFDAIFLDLRMPRMDGFEVAEKIRSGALGVDVQSIPIAVVSAEVVDEERRNSLQVDEFFSKPLEFQNIKNFVNDLPIENRNIAECAA